MLGNPCKDFCLWFLNLIMVGIIWGAFNDGEAWASLQINWSRLSEKTLRLCIQESQVLENWGRSQWSPWACAVDMETTHCVCETKEDSEVKWNTVRRRSWNSVGSIEKPLTCTYLAWACMLSHFSHVWLFATLCTIPLSMGFSRKNTGVGCPALLQGSSQPRYGIPHLLCLLHWQVDSLPPVPPGKPTYLVRFPRKQLQEAVICR